ncbi:fructose-1,6-bisphosphatase-3 [Bacillus velezensis]|nr:fructose 1,6-bisphosphatase [Bacillus velezensis TrigoCor1448]MDF9766364.1 fructose-1,6-bisphosphatase-3 [Bacillus velezensis]MDF9781585.1 fructose-1,6-bisphosphatase-3 [Bacillus velezensis]
MIVIVGYTLLYNSYGMQLVADKHFKSKAEVLSTEIDNQNYKYLITQSLFDKSMIG